VVPNIPGINIAKVLKALKIHKIEIASRNFNDQQFYLHNKSPSTHRDGIPTYRDNPIRRGQAQRFHAPAAQGVPVANST
jgi:hypothetical protein